MTTMPDNDNRRAASRWRRLMRKAALIAPITAAIGMIGAPAIANAEWDIGQYDRCAADVNFQYREGDISTADMILGYNQCCISSGGQLDGNNCSAPPAISGAATATAPSQAANPDVPAASPPSPTPKTPPTRLTPAPIAPVG